MTNVSINIQDLLTLAIENAFYVENNFLPEIAEDYEMEVTINDAQRILDTYGIKYEINENDYKKVVYNLVEV